MGAVLSFIVGAAFMVLAVMCSNDLRFTAVFAILSAILLCTAGIINRLDLILRVMGERK